MRDGGVLVAQGAPLPGGRVAVVVRDGHLLRWQVWEDHRRIAEGTDTPPRRYRRSDAAVEVTLQRLMQRYGRPAAHGRAS